MNHAASADKSNQEKDRRAEKHTDHTNDMNGRLQTKPAAISEKVSYNSESRLYSARLCEKDPIVQFSRKSVLPQRPVASSYRAIEEAVQRSVNLPRRPTTAIGIRTASARIGSLRVYSGRPGTASAFR